jgi:hypothetical protein
VAEHELDYIISAVFRTFPWHFFIFADTVAACRGLIIGEIVNVGSIIRFAELKLLEFARITFHPLLVQHAFAML